jgi:hypothetical protein
MLSNMVAVRHARIFLVFAVSLATIGFVLALADLAIASGASSAG